MSWIYEWMSQDINFSCWPYHAIKKTNNWDKLVIGVEIGRCPLKSLCKNLKVDFHLCHESIKIGLVYRLLFALGDLLNAWYKKDTNNLNFKKDDSFTLSLNTSVHSLLLLVLLPVNSKWWIISSSDVCTLWCWCFVKLFWVRLDGFSLFKKQRNCN